MHQPLITLSDIPGQAELETLSAQTFPLIFRRDFPRPGFALLSFTASVSSRALRRFMLDWKQSLGSLYREEFGHPLSYLSLARFDQQVTTKFHLDASPPESYLMLGYEPTSVRSAVALADYTRAAHEWGIDVPTLLSDFNPMFGPHEERLLPYVTQLPELDNGRSHVLLINNSSLTYEPGRGHSLGVMHQATILRPDPQASRVVNSIMLAAGEERESAELLERFATSQEVAGEILGQHGT